MKVTLFYRKKRPELNSIEEIFGAITNKLATQLSITKVSIPSDRANFRGLFKNLIYTFKHKSEINHITGHINYIGIVTGSKTLLTIHDVKSSFNGNSFHDLLIKIVWYWIPALFVKRIAVISEFSKMELIAIIPFAKQKIKVVSNPVKDELTYIKKVFKSDQPVILHIGTKTNKNLENTIRALEGITCKFHIIGKLSETQLLLLKKYNIDYKNDYFVPYHKIIDAYEQCDLLSFVSTYEGFGMPIIEAQTVGRPVITSNLGAMKEVAENSACLIDPFNVVSIRNGILKVIEDEEYRDELIDKGLKNVERFKLEKIANEYFDLYKELDS